MDQRLRQKVELYPHEQPTQGIWEINGVVTAVWIKPDNETLDETTISDKIRQRVQAVVKVNPWLAGWLDFPPKKFKDLWASATSPAYLKWWALREADEDDVEEKASLEEAVERVFQNRIEWESPEQREAFLELSATAATSSFDSPAFCSSSTYLREKCPQTKMPNGFGLLQLPFQKSSHSPPLCKVAWDYCPSKNRVLLILSLAHPIADGATYFRIFQMLMGETQPYALDATRKWNPSFSQFRKDEMGKRDALQLDDFKTTKYGSMNIVGRVLASLFRSLDPKELFCIKVNREGVKRVRTQLAASAGRKISSNDILLSALTQVFQIDGRWHMWKDFRHDFFQSLDCEESPGLLAIKAAGNYIGLLNIFAKEINAHSQFRKNSKSLARNLVKKVRNRIKPRAFPVSRALHTNPEPRLSMKSVIKAKPDYDALNQVNPSRRMANLANWTSLQKSPRALPQEFQNPNTHTDSDLLPGGVSVLLFLPLSETPATSPYDGGSFIIFHPDFSTDDKGVKNSEWISAYADRSMLHDFIETKQTFQFIDSHHSNVQVPFQEIFSIESGTSKKC